LLGDQAAPIYFEFRKENCPTLERSHRRGAVSLQHELGDCPHHRVRPVRALSRPLIAAARNHPEELRLQLWQAPVQHHLPRLEQPRDRLGAVGLPMVAVTRRT